MGAAFRMRNQNSGLIQIDQNYINYAVRGTAGLSVSTNVGNVYQNTVTVAASAGAVIGFRSDVPMYIWRQYPGADTRQIMFRATTPGSVTVYVFDLQQYGYVAADSHAKLRMRRQDGSLIMDSRMVQMKMLEFLHRDSEVNFPTYSRQYPGFVPVVVQNQLFQVPTRQPLAGSNPAQEIDVLTTSAAMVSGDTVTFQQISFGSTPHNVPTVPPPDMEQRTSDYSVVDITGLV